jgi:hypothetical protein
MPLPKHLKSFRFNNQTYIAFKQTASKNGYTATAALEKFMESSVEHGLVFPSASKTEDTEAEARILLAWQKQGQAWYYQGKDEVSTSGRLLELLPKIGNAQLRAEIEETLKKKP